MRPVDKLKPGDRVLNEMGVTEVIKETYSPYRKAKDALVGNLGKYCSYCESYIAHIADMHVEHIKPKGLDKFKELETSWNNFLVACSSCNDIKGDKDIEIAPCHLPHINNTFLSFLYKDGGVVMVNPDLKGVSKVHAENLLSLVGLDRSPANSSPQDRRWLERQKIWNLAIQNLERYDGGIVNADTIIELAEGYGGWSIWFTVFKGRDEIRKRLIDDFKYTCKECFDADNHYEPIPRNPGCDDPV